MPVTGVFKARSAIKFVVLVFLALRSTRSPASYHRAVALDKFFENTRDGGLGAQTMVSTRLQKNF
jgi:hypothetical protein